MTIFTDDDLSDTPILTEWQIVGGLNRQPQLFGMHAFHEGTRVAAAEVVIVDPMLRSVITPHGGYKLAGGGTLAPEFSRFGTEKRDH
jgi:hypothetical protein